MSRLPPNRDRALRIELLRARAVIERQSMIQNAQQLGESLTPRGLMESFLPGGGKRSSPSDLLMKGYRLTRRYPMVLSLGSALLTATARRRMRWLKLAAGAVVAWQVSRNLKK